MQMSWLGCPCGVAFHMEGTDTSGPTICTRPPCKEYLAHVERYNRPLAKILKTEIKEAECDPTISDDFPQRPIKVAKVAETAEKRQKRKH